MTIFVLFVHVVTLLLAATLFVGMSATDGNNQVPNVLMSMVIGLATVLTLLKTQGVMMQFSYVGMGARNARKLGSQFMNGVSYLTGKGRAAMASASGAATGRGSMQLATAGASGRGVRGNTTVIRATSSSNKQASGSSSKSNRAPTGTTTEAPKATSRSEALKQSTKNDKEAKL
jgi:hypothetical protein